MERINHYLKALEHVLGVSDKELALHEPRFVSNEWEYVKSCLDSGWVSSVGEYVNRFEEKLASFTEIPYAVATVNGTAALHICLLLVGVKPQDEVLVPSLTFIATANAVAYCSAIPHFVDSDPENLGIDVSKLREYLQKNTVIKDKTCINKITGRIIRAIIPVHIFGHPVDIDPLLEVSEQYHLKIVEDASESLGSYYKGKHTGHFSEIACLSFNGNKVITCGGGGAILTNNPELARKAKYITTTAKRPHRWEFFHDELGYNYRLPNINAALGCAQLEQLPHFLAKKRKLAERYQEAFLNFEELTVLQEPKLSRSNYWLNAIILKEPNRQIVENLINTAHQHNYGLRGLWTPLEKSPMYHQCPKMDLTNTARLFDSVIALPSSPHLERSDA